MEMDSQGGMERQVDFVERLYRNHYYGAWLRTGASLFMWAFAFGAYRLQLIKYNNIAGISASVLFLILMNPVILWILRRPKSNRASNLFSLVTNLIEVIAYTAIIYFLGGIRAFWMSPIYVVLINYIGIVGQKKTPFIVATFCGVVAVLMVSMEYVGILPCQDPIPNLFLPGHYQATIVITVAVYLQIVALVSAYIGALLRKSRRKLREKNTELENSNRKLALAGQVLEEAHQELEMRVEERTADLVKTNKKLEAEIKDRKRMEEALRASEDKLVRSKKMESLGLLAGGVAHDLNNILSGIVSYPELLLMDLPPDSNLREPLSTIKDSGYRAAAVIQDLLTIARGVATTKEPVNLNNLIRNYLNSPEFRKLEQLHSSVTFKTDLDTELLNIIGSHVHVRKVVMNLVINAAEAVDSGGNVTISTMNRYIDKPIAGYDDVTIGEYAVLAVSDDGSGISPDDLSRIFEPFYTKKIMGLSGTGLGLAVVWNVVQDHRGYIDVTSDKNGTTIESYFQITRDEMLDEGLFQPIDDLMGRGETILVIDDEKNQREISSRILNRLGYISKAVSSGEEAVEYLKENFVDLLLLDMIMDPGINCHETYERIVKIHPSQKALIVSGFAETDKVKGTQKLGAGEYLKKPLTLERLGLAVKRELGK
ncbi:MAG: response regulator [Desulfobacterales bacterium]|nr:response regulator [Desulfobacterales bacterium]